MTESSGGFNDELSTIDPQGVHPERHAGGSTKSDEREASKITTGPPRVEPVTAGPGEPAVGEPAVGEPAVGEPASGRLEASEWERSYRADASGVRAALRARLNNELDVEDCLNRVFEKLWSQGQAIAPASRRSWLFVVARNEAALLGRKAQRAAGAKPVRATVGENPTPRSNPQRANHHDREHEQVCRSQDPAPLERLLREEQIESVRRASRRLTDDQAEVLRCRFVEDLPFHEIATRLGIPLGTALSRAHAAIKRLRAELVSPEDE